MNITIKIPLDRYEDLLETETRVSVLLETIRHGEVVNDEDIYRIMGRIPEANRLKEEREARWNKKDSAEDTEDGED